MSIKLGVFLPDVNYAPNVDPSAVLGPNVSIGFGVTVGPGVRIRESIILGNSVLKNNCCVLHSIIGWNSIVGAWARIEGTPSDPDPNKQYAKIEHQDLFNKGKLNPSITIIGSNTLQYSCDNAGYDVEYAKSFAS
ncbi:mannose-1-phosphate guanyltransferase alpha isoform X1 [Brachionus plicatilis]|uniref:Mannose-1-phosphate guanyltransferase alpha isoform X1 n=1 Tax=Brachionus plicatilis TaxID=10195 RepID=A0A3M7T5M6_BRAPC|nr:mannose-1-phosphate guanyltransferase alpha isoform X1 [Brachionus plicatilis]